METQNVYDRQLFPLRPIRLHGTVFRIRSVIEISPVLFLDAFNLGSQLFHPSVFVTHPQAYNKPLQWVCFLVIFLRFHSPIVNKTLVRAACRSSHYCHSLGFWFAFCKSDCKQTSQRSGEVNARVGAAVRRRSSPLRRLRHCQVLWHCDPSCVPSLTSIRVDVCSLRRSFIHRGVMDPLFRL